MPISPEAQKCVIKYLELSSARYTQNFNIREQLLRRDKAYYRETDNTVAQRQAFVANESGDASKIQNITLPVVMPQVEAALADLHETFLTGYPIFGVVGPPDKADELFQMETLIGENSIRAAWPTELLQTMRDGLKYDLGAIEVTWENRKTFAITTPADNALTEGSAQETYYAGNFLKRLDPYNITLDTRVAPERNHIEGEFARYGELISRIELKRRLDNLPPLGCMNFKAAFESPSVNGYSGDNIAGVYTPSINPNALLPIENRQGGTNWLSWMSASPAKDGIQYQDTYQYDVLYCRILPADLQIHSKNKNHIAIYKFIVINCSTVVFAERQTNAHNYLPIIVCKPSNDGQGWQSKSFAENAMPMQAVASSLLNSGLESQRRKVYDRIYYDPSRINKKDIDQVSSVARIPIKNSAYGKPIQEAIHESPYRDDGVQEIMSMSQQMVQVGDTVNGINKVQQGQFQKGNKTRKEFDTVMGNAGSRGRMRALALEYTFFVPIKEIIKSNYLQYQPARSLVNTPQQQTVQIDPEALRKANLSFTLSDGYLPQEKLLSTEMFSTLFQAAQALPAIAAEYDLMGIFMYSMQLSGGGWMSQFKRSDADKAAYLQQMQAASTAAGPEKAPAAKPTGASA